MTAAVRHGVGVVRNGLDTAPVNRLALQGKVPGPIG